MQRFSIIVPVIGDSQKLDDTLASVLRYRPENSQILVVHDGTYDDPYGLDGEVELVTTSRQSQLIRLFNCGLGKATGELIALVRPGVQLDEHWNQDAETVFENPKVGCASPLLVKSNAPNTLVSAGVTNGFGFQRKLVGNQKQMSSRNLRKLKAKGPTSHAGFYRRSALDQLGAVDEQLDASYLDLELALGLASLGYQNAVCGHCTVTIEDNALNHEAIQPHGKSAQRALRRHAGHDGFGLLIRSTIFAMGELLKAPIQPNRAWHVIQRLSALGTAKSDRQFNDRISNSTRHPEAAVLRFQDHESTSDSNHHADSTRKAA